MRCVELNAISNQQFLRVYQLIELGMNNKKRHQSAGKKESQPKQSQSKAF
jgi:hypothetical protein